MHFTKNRIQLFQDYHGNSNSSKITRPNQTNTIPMPEMHLVPASESYARIMIINIIYKKFKKIYILLAHNALINAISSNMIHNSAIVVH